MGVEGCMGVTRARGSVDEGKRLEGVAGIEDMGKGWMNGSGVWVAAGEGGGGGGEKLRRNTDPSKGIDSPLFLRSCIINNASTRTLSQLHAHLITSGQLLQKPFLSTNLISAYSSPNNSIQTARLVFEALPNKAISSWNSLIRGFTWNRLFPQSLLLFKRLLLSSTKPDLFTFILLFKSCSALLNVNYGLGLHGFVVKSGLGRLVMVGNSLVSLYSKFGRIGEAVQVFDEMPVRDCVSYNSLIWGYGFNGFYKEALLVFDRMEELGFCADPVSTVSALKACGELGSVKRGAAIHELVSRNGFGSDIRVLNSLISMYSKFGRLDLACDLFYEMPERDLVSWNSMISGYAQNGNWMKSFSIFRLMKIEKCVPNCVTFLGLILACGQARNFDLGKSIHGHLIRVELLSDIRIGTSVLDMYAKCGRVDFAHKVFEQLYERSLISWNSLIAGYSQNSFDYEAIALFRHMLLESYLKPDSITTANVIPSYAKFGDLRGSCMIHGFIVKIGFPLDEDVVLGTAMVDMYAKSFDIGAASYLFLCIVKPNVAAWNAIIAGYSVNDLSCHCLQLFRQMLHSGVSPDSITAIIMLQSCSDLRSLKQGMLIHCYSICSGFDSYLTVGNAIIDMYIKCGCVEDSEKKFNTMPLRNVVTWNTVLCGYVRIGLYMDVFHLFYQMLFNDRYKPDLITMISVLQACASSSNLQHGQIIHDFILKNGFDSDFLVANSLIDFYAKNGFIECAWSVFEGMCLRDRSSWNVMIAACGMNGQGEKACSLLFQMEETGFQPDSITFVCFLSACSHTGLINEGYTYFKYMIEKYKIEPTAKHYSCIIDMFGRAGRLEEAYRLIAKMPEGSNYSTVWAALLSACRISKNDELGGLVGEKLIQLAPENCGYYALLSNTYASTGKWDEAEKVRRVFEERGLVKKPGLSTIKM